MYLILVDLYLYDFFHMSWETPQTITRIVVFIVVVLITIFQVIQQITTSKEFLMN